MTTKPSKSDSAAGTALSMLFFAAIGWVAAWYIAPGVESPPPAPERITVVHRDTGRPLPAWVQEVLGAPSIRSEALARAGAQHENLLSNPAAIELDYEREGDAPPMRAEFSIRHPDPAAVTAVGEWLAEIVRDEVAFESRRRSAREQASRNAEQALENDVESLPDDALRNEIAAEQQALDDLRHEHRILKAEEIQIWSLRTQAQGQLDAIRESLDATPPIQLVKKKLIDEGALAGAKDEEGFDVARRVQSLSFEEEMPNPIYSHLRGLEEQVMAQGTGYQRRLQELEQERRNVDDQMNLTSGRIRTLQSDLDRESYITSVRQGSNGAGSRIASPATPTPVRVVHPRSYAIAATAPSLLEDRTTRLGLGALLGALFGWVIAQLGYRSAARATAPALVATLALLWTAAPAAAQPEIGVTAPELKGSGVKWLNSKAIPVRKLQGKVVFLEFFQTTYEGYESQITHIREFMKRHTDKEITYIGVVSGETPKKVEAFVKEKGIEYPIVVDRYAKVQKNYNIGKATLAIIAPDGNIAWTGNPFTLHRVGDYELERVLTAFEKQVAAIYVDATSAFLEKEYARAIELFEKVQARDPRPAAKEGATGFLERIQKRADELMALAELYAELDRRTDQTNTLERIAREFRGLEAGELANKALKALKRGRG